MVITETAGKHVAHSYFLLRLGTGLCFAVHGALRFSRESYFEDLLQTATWISDSSATVLILYAYVMPAVELLSGLLLCLGFLKRWAITGLLAIMIVWILSSVFLEYWQNMGAQLLFFFILYWLFFKLGDDQWSFDRFLKHY